ncbi:hypothetical protein DEIPH_ctg095orf0001 [Deinococcus phoenicis]|uniref:Phosphohydrolase-associated domain-containing protein n=1 Tax=Deinococcus phoenicis TaxID=1476583 RepID=A0A016QKT8_9DEIO|nr:hypothetical protein DEIPH_ctg095orf0001 [Deinococcus phoenicis]
MQVEQATRLLNTLFTAFLARPTLLPPQARARAETDGLPRAVCDFIAGMTDRYAGEMHAALVPPPLPSGWPG